MLHVIIVGSLAICLENARNKVRGVIHQETMDVINAENKDIYQGTVIRIVETKDK